MGLVDSLLNITDYFSGEEIALHHGQCMNRRFRQIGCTMCADACPAEDAITLTLGLPKLNNDACVHCGLCLHHCPTGAFTRPDPTLNRLPATANAIPTPDIDLICPQHPTPAQGTAPAAIFTKRCLAALSPAHLLPLTTQSKHFQLDDSPCAECPIGSVQPYIADTVAKTNAWAKMLPEHTPISLRSATTDETPEQPRAIVDIDRPPISRRGFFRSLTQMGRESLGAMLAEDPVDPAMLGRSVPVSKRLPHTVPPRRARVLSFLDSQVLGDEDTPVEPLIAAEESSLPVLDVQVKLELCTACGLCSRFCPTSAITFLNDESQFALAFYPALCLGDECQICELACPEEAIILKKIDPTPTVLSKKPRYIAAGNLRPCAMCGQPITDSENHPTTCHACRPHKNTLFQFP